MILIELNRVYAHRVCLLCKKLQQFRLPRAKYTSAQLSCNKGKNRALNALPYEFTRVPLQPIRGVEGSDYINASFVDSYRDRRAYIATQSPLAKTVEDFWRMMWELNSNIVVMLTKLVERGRVSLIHPGEVSISFSGFFDWTATAY